jgi:hypothetical protein
MTGPVLVELVKDNPLLTSLMELTLKKMVSVKLNLTIKSQPLLLNKSKTPWKPELL